MSLDSILASAAEAQSQGRLHEAETLLRSAGDVTPNAFRIWIQLSVLSRLRGDLESAESDARHAIAIRPTGMEGHLQLGLSLMAQARFDEAIKSFTEAIRIKPALAPLFHNLGLCEENLGQKEKAAAAFREAIRLEPRDPRSRLSLGALYLAEEKLDQAIDCAKQALQINPSSADAHILMAKTLNAKKLESEAEVHARKAVELNPNSSLAHTLLGFRQLQNGEFQDAEISFKRSLELDPNQGVGYFGICQSRKITETDRSMIEQMEAVNQSSWLSYDELGYLAFGLTKAYENLGEYEKAMHHCHEAHRFNFHIRNGKKFDRGAYTANIDATIEIYSADRMATPLPNAFASALPIFIVGMMRSGTTLTEQIVSSHHQVAAAGENWFWPTRAYQADDRKKMEFHSTQAVSLAREYCRGLQQVSPHSSRITDKLPGNYHHLGLLNLAMPRTKAVHLIRNPLDTSLSIYFTPNTTAPDFSHSPDDIVFVYEQYLRLMGHWREVLPANFVFEIVYEELVEDPEPIIRKLIAFLGLDWEDACLHHERNAKAVKTPSVWQVRQPMYKTSAGRWKRYEPWLGDFSKLLPELIN